jgi:hypothetical protein
LWYPDLVIGAAAVVFVYLAVTKKRISDLNELKRFNIVVGNTSMSLGSHQGSDWRRASVVGIGHNETCSCSW